MPRIHAAARISVRVMIRSALTAILAVVLFVGPASAIAAPTALDRRVSAIPAHVLLGTPATALVDRRREAASAGLRQWDRPLFIAWALAQITAFFFIWNAGYAAGLRNVLRRRLHGTMALRFSFAALLVYAGALAGFPVSFAHWRIDLALGTTMENAANWVRDGVVNTTVDAVIVGLIVASIFALVDRTRLWWIYATAGLFIITLRSRFSNRSPSRRSTIASGRCPAMRQSGCRSTLSRRALASSAPRSRSATRRVDPARCRPTSPASDRPNGSCSAMSCSPMQRKVRCCF